MITSTSYGALLGDLTYELSHHPQLDEVRAMPPPPCTNHALLHASPPIATCTPTHAAPLLAGAG